MDAVANVAGLVDICLRYGCVVVQTCKSYKHADMEIRETILQIESLWLKIQRQLEFLKEVWPSLDEEYQIHQNTYAITVKNNLKSALVDLKEWAEAFDVSWFLILRSAGKDIDQQLKSVVVGKTEPLSILKTLREAIALEASSNSQVENTTIFLREGFFLDEYTALKNSGAEIWLGRGNGEESRYLVDQQSSVSTLSDRCKLAKILRNVDPFNFGILKCEGLVKESISGTDLAPTRFVFAIPKTLQQPQLLRMFVMSRSERHPLDDKFELSKQLAKAIMFVHSAGFVHKNIRPETVLLFYLNQPNENSCFAFLIGFESFRLAEGNTVLQGDNVWERNIYRHPTRQGMQPGMDYVMQHDIYSLGVCLLEIGLGESLILPQAGGKESKPNPLLFANVDLTMKDRRKKAFQTKRALVLLAQERLPSIMGRKYTELVVTCMTCLDKPDNLFGDEEDFLDENGVLVGVRFIEKVKSFTREELFMIALADSDRFSRSL
ncbi:HET-s domain protein [Rutstroemia sp. NJR-2017a WRK4]|nr:HET-s domain protein [Rutstroemia sp. NJR-2017a WRK4]PQE14781.1 HET-s domain protein [Rutstroemia sp. NJR-2017a WRK4]